MKDDSFTISAPGARMILAWAVDLPTWRLSVSLKASRRESAVAVMVPVVASTTALDDAWAWRAASRSPVMSPLRASLEEEYCWLRATRRLPLWSWTASGRMGYSLWTMNG